jgi:hypothetical protein
LPVKIMPIFADRGCNVVGTTTPTAVNLNFLYLEPLLFHSRFSYDHEAEWTPFQTHYFSENLVAPGIETGTSGSVARISDH